MFLLKLSVLAAAVALSSASVQASYGMPPNGQAEHHNMQPRAGFG